MTERTSCRYEAGIAYITMDDATVNVTSTQMLHELDAALDRAQADRAIVVLRSMRKGIFSVGFDLKVLAANNPVQSHEMARAGRNWRYATSGTPKLFVDADPGARLIGGMREFYCAWKNQDVVTVHGKHFCRRTRPRRLDKRSRPGVASSRKLTVGS